MKLLIVFHANKRTGYMYEGITPYIYNEFIKAESKGEYHARSIKHKAFEKVDIIN